MNVLAACASMCRAAGGSQALSGQHWPRIHFQTAEPTLVASGSICNSSVTCDMMGAQELLKKLLVPWWVCKQDESRV